MRVGVSAAPDPPRLSQAVPTLTLSMGKVVVRLEGLFFIQFSTRVLVLLTSVKRVDISVNVRVDWFMGSGMTPVVIVPTFVVGTI